MPMEVFVFPVHLNVVYAILFLFVLPATMDTTFTAINASATPQSARLMDIMSLALYAMPVSNLVCDALRVPPIAPPA